MVYFPLSLCPMILWLIKEVSEQKKQKHDIVFCRNKRNTKSLRSVFVLISIRRNSRQTRRFQNRRIQKERYQVLWQPESTTCTIAKVFRASYYTCICIGIDDRRNHRGRTEITRDVESRWHSYWRLLFQCPRVIRWGCGENPLTPFWLVVDTVLERSLDFFL